MCSSPEELETAAIHKNAEEEEEKESLRIVNENECALNGENTLASLGNCSSSESDCISENDIVNGEGDKGLIISANGLKNEKGQEFKLVLTEYERVKDELLKLQVEYKSSLQRERSLCERLQNFHGEEDSKVSQLSKVNEELREQLDNLLEELNTKKNELKSSKCNLEDTQKERDKLSTELAKLHIERLEERDSLREKVRHLEGKEKAQTEELDTVREKLQSHDQAAKRAIASIQKEMALRVDQVTKMYEDALKDKESATIKITHINEDKKKIFIEKELLNGKVTENSKEIEKLRLRLKHLQTELLKAQQEFEDKEKEFITLHRDQTKLKDEMNTHVVKVKWAHNKLKSELEAHKETKVKFNQVTQKLKEAKEEGEMIRANCQALIKKYQESEEMKSNSLDHKLKQKEYEIRKHEQEIADQDEVHRMKMQELVVLKDTQKKYLGEIKEYKAQVSMLEEKVTLYALKVAEHEKNAMTLKKYSQSKMNELQEALEYKDKYTMELEKVAELTEETANQQVYITELEADISAGHTNQSQLLEFTEKMTAKNAQLQSEVSSIQAKFDSVLIDKSRTEEQLEEIRQSKEKMENDFINERTISLKNLEELGNCIQEKTKAVEYLSLVLEEAKDELQVMKRKNTAAIKDLTRQLQQSRRQVEKLEFNQLGSKESLNGDSKSSSTNSLDKISSNCTSPTTINNPSTTACVTDSGVQAQDSVQILQPVPPSIRADLEPDKKILVDRICRLQKIHAKKNEKLEFMDEHINALVDEIQKKARIIQYYALREDSGTLIPPRSDVNKAQLARHGGIMASLYSSKPADRDMTLELSLEINRKLQAVFEDTILKNMTLKENLDTLGDEITRLNEQLFIYKKGRR